MTKLKEDEENLHVILIKEGSVVLQCSYVVLKKA